MKLKKKKLRHSLIRNIFNLEIHGDTNIQAIISSFQICKGFFPSICQIERKENKQSQLPDNKSDSLVRSIHLKSIRIFLLSFNKINIQNISASRSGQLNYPHFGNSIK